MRVFHRKCTFCKLAKTSQTVCMNGIGNNIEPKLIVFVDNPTKEEDYRHKAGASKSIQLIQWMFDRMSIPPSEYRIEFSIRCHAESKDLKTKATFEPIADSCSIHHLATLRKYPKAILIAMGSLSCYQFTGKQKHGDFEGAYWIFDENTKRRVWITYAPGAALQAPAECPTIYRVFWTACEQAGLKPEFNAKLKPFEFDI